MKYLSFLLCFLILGPEVSGQYFGRNKPRYETFNFNVLETPHFDIHSYTKSPEVLDFLAKDSELWYEYHAQALDHDIPFLNPLIFYNNHAEFQQTNSISGGIGVGTGGVTEGFKNRVVMPVAFSNQQTHQVLGHELVHAFQFNIILGGDSTSMRSLANIPLWVIEGMAEYMSIGRVDPFTAMWMRNAILNDNIPSLEKMANPKYFPYRYGQTAWSLLAGSFGDQTLKPFLLETGKYGMNIGARQAFGMSLDNLSNLWEEGVKNHFKPFLRDQKESNIGKTLLSSANSGSLNVSPSLSPNGRWVVFLSEKDLFSTDLFLADARTGKIERKLSSLVKDSDLDNFNYLESAGTWSPNSRQFAFIGFSKGQHLLVIKDITSGKTEKSYKIPGVPAITNPTWSPDGKEIVFAGSVEGVTDLFSFNLRTKKVRQLTNDIYSEIQPSFNSDGSKLVFSYDKRSMTEGRYQGRWTYDLAIMNYPTGEIEVLDIFHNADNINAAYDDEDNIYFLSDRDGYRNMYHYRVEEDAVYMMTDFLTGLSGIARYSPAISVARKRDRVLFTHYYGSEYIIKEGSREDLLNQKVDKIAVDQTAGTLPGGGLNKTDIVMSNLEQIDQLYESVPRDFKKTKYKSKFKLDNVSGGVGAGVNNGSQFGLNNGLQAAGAVQMLFSDILGNNQLVGQAALNGTVQDFGGQLFYINRKNKLAWGGGISHVPQAFGTVPNPMLNIPITDVNGATFNANLLERSIYRVFDQTASGFLQMPFSTTLRLEGGASIGHQTFREDKVTDYFTLDWFYLGQDREKLESAEEVSFNQFYTIQKGMEGSFYVALVGDKSHFGLTSPLYGERFRLSAERSFGINDYYAINADYRKYIWMKPISLAFRAQGYKRFEQDVNSIFPNYIGQMGLVRGYDFVFDSRVAGEFGDIGFNQLLGSSFGITSIEARLPFSGPKQLALIGSKILFTDLALFFDAGMAFNDFSDIGSDLPGAPELVMSVGASVRVNLFGSMILEPYWAYPLQKNSRVVFGLNFIPGW